MQNLSEVHKCTILTVEADTWTAGANSTAGCYVRRVRVFSHFGRFGTRLRASFERGFATIGEVSEV